MGIAEIIVAKHRNGPTGIASMRFDNEYARFQNLDDYAVGRNYVERPSRMNKQVSNDEVAGNLTSPTSDFNAHSRDPLPF